MVLYAEGLDLPDDPLAEIEFEGAKTAVLIVVPMANGEVGVRAERADISGIAFWFGKFTVRREDIIATQNTIHPEFLENIRKAISPIVPAARVNPRDFKLVP